MGAEREHARHTNRAHSFTYHSDTQSQIFFIFIAKIILIVEIVLEPNNNTIVASQRRRNSVKLSRIFVGCRWWYNLTFLCSLVFNYSKMNPNKKPLVLKSTPITEEYELSNTVLGLGINGKVIQCYSKASGEKYALKVSQSPILHHIGFTL